MQRNKLVTSVYLKPTLLFLHVSPPPLTSIPPSQLFPPTVIHPSLVFRPHCYSSLTAIPPSSSYHILGRNSPSPQHTWPVLASIECVLTWWYCVARCLLPVCCCCSYCCCLALVVLVLTLMVERRQERLSREELLEIPLSESWRQLSLKQ